MLVLSRKNDEAVVIGGSEGFERMIKVTVVEIKNGRRETGFRGRRRCSGPSLGGVGTDLWRDETSRLAILNRLLKRCDW